MEPFQTVAPAYKATHSTTVAADVALAGGHLPAADKTYLVVEETGESDKEDLKDTRLE